MAITQVIHLKQETFGLPPIIHMVQGDTGRTLKMIIDDGELPASPTATLYWMRSDLSHYSANAWYDSDDNSFTADVSQALTQPHNTQCQLKVTDSNDVIVSTYTFIIDVQTDVDGTSEAQLGYSIEEITEIIDSARGGGMSEDVKQALLNCFYHVAWVDSHGQDYVDNLEEALYPPAVLTSITAYYNQTGTIYDTDDLDDLKPDLTVMANYDNGQSVPVSTYTLSGSLVAGTSTIRVNYDTKYTTFDVTVTHMPGIISVVNNLVNATNSNSATTVSEGDSYTATISPASGYTLTGASVIITMGSTDITSSVYSNGTISIDEVTDTLTISVSAVAVTLVSISAVYTQSGTVYDTDSLDSLKTDLVVTATYSDSSSEIVTSADYTLSGTLTAGTSTITVSYGGKTTTFTVTVTAELPSEYQKVEWVGAENTNLTPSSKIVIGNAIPSGSVLNIYAEVKPLVYVGADTSPFGGYAVTGSVHSSARFYPYYNNSLSSVTPYGSGGATVSNNQCAVGDTWDTVKFTESNPDDALKFFIFSGIENSKAFNGKIRVLDLVKANGDTLYHFIPCYRKADNVIGFYDPVTETFYTGTGTFIKGSNV